MIPTSIVSSLALSRLCTASSCLLVVTPLSSWPAFKNAACPVWGMKPGVCVCERVSHDVLEQVAMVTLVFLSHDDLNRDSTATIPQWVNGNHLGQELGLNSTRNTGHEDISDNKTEHEPFVLSLPEKSCDGTRQKSTSPLSHVMSVCATRGLLKISVRFPWGISTGLGFLWSKQLTFYCHTKTVDIWRKILCINEKYKRPQCTICLKY